MTTYAKVEMTGGPVLAYPYTFRMLRKEKPGISFPRVPTDAQLATWGCQAVTETPKPVPAITEDVLEVTPVWVNDDLCQTWSVVPAPAEEIALRQKFKRNIDERVEIKLDTFVDTFINMTPAEVAAHVEDNVNNLAGAKILLKRMAVMILLLTRREFED